MRAARRIRWAAWVTYWLEFTPPGSSTQTPCSSASNGGSARRSCFHVLGERRVPYEALSAVELAPGGKRGTVVLRAVPRPGADPLLEAAAGQLKDGCDPYRLVLPAERETLADYYATELRALSARTRKTRRAPHGRRSRAAAELQGVRRQGFLRRQGRLLPLVLDGGLLGEVEGR